MEDKYKPLMDLLSGIKKVKDPIMSVGEPSSFIDSNLEEASIEPPVENVEINETVNTVDNSSRSSNKDNALKSSRNLNDIITDLNSFRSKSVEDLQEARQKDNNLSLYANILNTLGTAGQANVQRNIGRDAGITPNKNIQSNINQQNVLDERNLNSESLLGELRIKQRDELTPYQQEILRNQNLNRDASNKRAEESRKLRDELKAQTENRLNEKELQRQDEYVSNKVIDLRKTLSKDDRFKQMTKEGLAFDQVDNLMKIADKGNQVAFGALGTKMARAMGEVGVLTDTDVTRYVNGGSLTRKAADTLIKMKEGKPSKASIEDIKQISNVLKDIHKTKLEPIFDEYAKTAYENLLISIRESYKRLSIPVPPKFEKSRLFFEKNKDKLKNMGITTEMQAEQYLIEQGKL